MRAAADREKPRIEAMTRNAFWVSFEIAFTVFDFLFFFFFFFFFFFRLLLSINGAKILSFEQFLMKSLSRKVRIARS